VNAFPLARLRKTAATFDSDAEWRWFLKGAPGPVRRALWEQWVWQAHGGQEEPRADILGERAPHGWRLWLLMAGRGFGKTRTGAEWIWARVRENPGAQVALVGASEAEAVRVMIDGPSGILATARSGEQPVWIPTKRVLHFGNGAEGFVYSGRSPEKLRGPEHHFAWADELAKWRHGDKTFDNLEMGLRLGERPRMIVTTTPRPVALVRRIRALEGTVETRGKTLDNTHLPEAFVTWAMETYGGTRLGRQELDGVLFEEVSGALWTRETIEKSRQSGTLPRLERIVVGVDPPVSAGGNACGIVVCGLSEDKVAYVLADCSVEGLRPEGWAKVVAKTAEAWEADRVVAEKNQGGDMVESVLRSAGAMLPVRLVSATRNKVRRAEPVAALFETGKAKLAGRFPALEDELAGLTAGGGYEGPGESPDRADAMVWAVDALAKPRAEPGIRGF